MTSTLSVPVELFIKAQKENFKNELSFFLLLKLLYPNGKTKLDGHDLNFIEITGEIKSRKTTKRFISKLVHRNFLIYNNKTDYYTIRSFNKIREMYQFQTRLAFPIDYQNYDKINAVTGAIIYGYLHRDYFRKKIKSKSADIKGNAYNFRDLHLSSKKQFAPVSVYGIHKIFDISIATASRLKQSAKKAQYLKVKKQFEKIDAGAALTLKKICKTNNLRCHKGQYFLQSIDLVCPLFYFTKRKKLK